MIADDSYSGSIVSILNIYPVMYRDTVFTIVIYPDMCHDTASFVVSSSFSAFCVPAVARALPWCCLVLRTHVSLPMVHLKIQSKVFNVETSQLEGISIICNKRPPDEN